MSKIAIDGKPRYSGNNRVMLVEGKLKIVPAGAVQLVEEDQWVVEAKELEMAIDVTPDLSGFTVDVDWLTAELLRRGIWFWEDARMSGDEIRQVIINAAGLAVGEIMKRYRR